MQVYELKSMIQSCDVWTYPILSLKTMSGFYSAYRHLLKVDEVKNDEKMLCGQDDLA